MLSSYKQIEIKVNGIRVFVFYSAQLKIPVCAAGFGVHKEQKSDVSMLGHVFPHLQVCEDTHSQAAHL